MVLCISNLKVRWFLLFFFWFLTTSRIPHLPSHLLSLQYDRGAASSAQVRSGDGKQLEVGGAAGSTVRDLSEMKDPSEMKALVSELSVFF